LGGRGIFSVQTSGRSTYSNCKFGILKSQTSVNKFLTKENNSKIVKLPK